MYVKLRHVTEFLIFSDLLYTVAYIDDSVEMQVRPNLSRPGCR